MKKIITAAVIVAVIATLVIVLLDSESDIIRIRTLLPKGEPMAAFAANELNGAKLAVKELNNEGGILGKRVELTEGTADLQIIHWPITESEIKQIDRDKIVSVVIAGGDIDVPKISPYIFRIWPSDALPVNVLVGYMSIDKKYKNVVVAHTKGDWEDSIIAAFNKYSSTTSMKITQVEVGDDLKQSVIETKSAGVNAVFAVIDDEETLAGFVNTARDNGYSGDIIYPRDISYSNLIGDVKLENLKNFIYPVFQPPNYLFVQAYSTEYETLPGLYADTAYDAIKIFAQAMNTASSTDPEKLIKSFTPYAGASGQIIFNPDGERSQVNVGLMIFDGLSSEPKPIQ